MGRRSKTRRVLKWTGTVGAALAFGVWALSLMHPIHSTTRRTLLWIADGEFDVLWSEDPHVIAQVREARIGFREWFEDWFPLQYFGRLYAQTRNVRACELWDFGPVIGTVQEVSVPLWMILAAVVAPTAFLWYRDRRHKFPGCCRKCGYNLTGNVSGRCPECGTACTSEGVQA